MNVLANHYAILMLHVRILLVPIHVPANLVFQEMGKLNAQVSRIDFYFNEGAKYGF